MKTSEMMEGKFRALRVTTEGNKVESTERVNEFLSDKPDRCGPRDRVWPDLCASLFETRWRIARSFLARARLR
jgi:hypothetical protein